MALVKTEERAAERDTTLRTDDEGEEGNMDTEIAVGRMMKDGATRRSKRAVRGRKKVMTVMEKEAAGKTTTKK